MRFISLLLCLPILLLSACSYFDSDTEEPALAGERISILDLQKELQPTAALSDINITPPPATMNENWSQAGGYPHHAMGNLALNNTDQLKLAWRVNIGAGADDTLPLTAQPIIAAGKVFTLDPRSTITAHDSQTGKRLWQNKDWHQIDRDDPVISSGLAYSGGVLYVTSGYNEVVALNPETGDIYWRTTISAPSRAAPTIHNGRVFVTALNNNAIALDARNGKILWEYEGVNETTGLLGSASPAANDAVMVSTSSSGDIAALRVENGSVLWRDSLANTLRLGGMSGLSDIRGLPVLSKDMLIAISYGGKIMAIDQLSGNRLWQQEISGSETPWVAGNTVYVFSTDYKLIALNRLNGDVLWITEIQKYDKLDARKGLITWAGPIMAGGRLILTGSNGRVLELSPQNGAEIAAWETKKELQLSPVVAGQTLYLLAKDGSLLAYR